jgi:hypothetical protein
MSVRLVQHLVSFLNNVEVWSASLPSVRSASSPTVRSPWMKNDD